MSIANIGSNTATAALLAAANPSQPPQVADSPHDGDGDDAGAGASRGAKAPGTGTMVDKTA